MLIRLNCCEECWGSAPRRRGQFPLFLRLLHFGHNWMELGPIHHGGGRPGRERFEERGNVGDRSRAGHWWWKMSLSRQIRTDTTSGPTGHEINVYSASLDQRRLAALNSSSSPGSAAEDGHQWHKCHCCMSVPPETMPCSLYCCLFYGFHFSLNPAKTSQGQFCQHL